MKLSQADASVFFEIMLQLQWYVCQQQNLLPNIKTFEEYTDTSMEEKVKVRNHLFTHPELIDQFTEENPANLPLDQLSIAADWKHFIRKDFYIERLLKRYSVFIDDDDTVYAVLGLNDSLNDLIDPRSLPIRVQTILLPFKGKIVYDGLLNWYNVFFGSGIKSSLKQTYLIAKDNNAIIETLPPQQAASQRSVQQPKATQDWSPLLDELAEKAKKLRGGQGQPAAYSPIFSLIRASVELAQMATSDQPEIDQLMKKGARIETLLQQVESAILRSF